MSRRDQSIFRRGEIGGIRILTPPRRAFSSARQVRAEPIATAGGQVPCHIPGEASEEHDNEGCHDHGSEEDRSVANEVDAQNIHCGREYHGHELQANGDHERELRVGPRVVSVHIQALEHLLELRPRGVGPDKHGAK
eukprot:scaffold2437_cov395-Prasinococcus_capsulatus_cf.AAC.20